MGRQRKSPLKRILETVEDIGDRIEERNEKREAETKQRTVKAKSKTTAKKTTARRASIVRRDLGEYTVKSGDTLSGIAQSYYGNAGLWTEIYEANKSVIGGNPNLIQVGQTYTIPKLD